MFSPIIPSETPFDEIVDKKNSLKIEDYSNLNWSLGVDDCDRDNFSAFLKYSEIINFSRSYKSHHCVMCGLVGNIPAQNKDVCKMCDTSFWFHTKLNLVIKFCKGCKNFIPLSEFKDKPEASKCFKCRHRGRKNYFARKQLSSDNNNKTMFYSSSEYESDGSLDTVESNLGKLKHIESVSSLTKLYSNNSSSSSSVQRPPVFPKRNSLSVDSPIPNLGILESLTDASLLESRLPLTRSLSDQTNLSSTNSSLYSSCISTPHHPTHRSEIMYEFKETPKSLRYASTNSKPTSSLKRSLSQLTTNSENHLYKSSPRTVSFSLTPPNINIAGKEETIVKDNIVDYSLLTYDKEKLLAQNSDKISPPGVKDDTKDKISDKIPVWEWNPETNPLMRLAMLTEHLSSKEFPKVQ